MIFILSNSSTAHDIWAPYRDHDKSSPSTPIPLIHYEQARVLLNEYLQQKIPSKERAILTGLKWLINFVDNNNNFMFLSTNLFILLHEMTRSQGREFQKYIAQDILKISLARAQKNLNQIYSSNPHDIWKFIGLLPIVDAYPEFKKSYYKFYQENFKQHKKELNTYKNIYTQALHDKNYKTIYDYLISTSFLHYYILTTKHKLRGLPHDFFTQALKELEQLNYDTNLETNSEDFINLGYLATHVILVLTNYGAFPIQESINMHKADNYIKTTLNKVKNLGYLDLLAEYIQCLKITHPITDNSAYEINTLEDFLISLQRHDGSWGSIASAQSNPYNAFHPTWAVLTALNQ